MAIMLFIFFIFLRPSTTAARNPLVDLSSSDYLRRAAGYGDEKLSTVVVNGSLLCDACLDGNSDLQSIPIHGASMAVSCDMGRKTSISNWIKERTDEYGDFLFDLPSHLHAVPNMEKRCIVRTLDLPRSSHCHQAYNDQRTQIKLSSSNDGFRTYTAPNIHLTPKISHSQACIKKQSMVNTMFKIF